MFSRLLDATRQQVRHHISSLPSLCAVCRGWGSSRVCVDCVTRSVGPVRRCEVCALQVPDGQTTCGACLTHPPPYARTVAGVDYDHPWDGLIRHFKFHAALDLAPALAARVLDAVAAQPLLAPTVLVPMPLSDLRLRERGYNQAWELTRRIARSLHCACDPTLLLRVKDTPHQLAFAPDRRAGNVRGAFAIEPKRAGDVRDRRITLVDDVMTTGATAAEAARTLLQAGASAVDVWVVARTPRPGEA